MCIFLTSASFPFTSRRSCGCGNMTVLIFEVTPQLKYFLGGNPHLDSVLYQVLGAVGFVNVEIKRFDLTRYHVIDVSHQTLFSLPHLFCNVEFEFSSFHNKELSSEILILNVLLGFKIRRILKLLSSN